MRKKPASGVLASLKGSTYRSVRLASSLAAALLDSLFAHPAWPGLFSVVSSLVIITLTTVRISFQHLRGN
jgi:hypothetical protein